MARPRSRAIWLKLESHAMGAVLEQAKSGYDLVVIDTPPLTAVSDAFPLLTKVDGVVIVGRVNHSRRDAAEQLHQVLASSGAPLLGVIANEAKSGGPIPYYPAGGGSSGTVVASDDGASSSEELAPTAGGLKTQIALKDSEYDPSRRPGSRDARLIVHGADPH